MALPIGEHPKLGKVPDSAIADELGCTRQQVSNIRRKLKIPPFRDHDPVGLRKAVLRAVWSRFTPVTREDVYHAVLNDYGSVAEATVYELLCEMTSTSKGWVKRVVDPEEPERNVGLYVRRR